MGALPLSKKANADANDVREGLNKLSGRITDAAEKVDTYSYIQIMSFVIHTSHS